MRKRLLRTIAALAAVGLAAGAVPAFTADSGTVTVSITAQGAAAPCLTVSPGTVDFGTLPFSTQSLTSVSNRDISWTNCGTADENLWGLGTNAVGPSGPWVLTDLPVCGDVGRFNLLAGGSGFATNMRSSGASLLSAGGSPVVFPAGQSTLGFLQIVMPCQGSGGAGEAKSLTVTFTAVVP